MIIKPKKYLPIITDNKIFIGITSYPKRINYIKDSLISLFNQSYKPDKIYLILSLEEFPNKTKDLPKFIIDFLENQNNFEILFVDENIKQFKKNIPLLKLYKNRDDVIIFTADDDLIYHKDYVKNMLSLFLENNKKCKSVITFDFPWRHSDKIQYNYKNDDIITNLIGYCEVIKPSFFTDIVTGINKNDINNKGWISEDKWITYNLRQNNIKFVLYPYNVLSSLLINNKTVEEINPLSDIHVLVPDPEKIKNIELLYNTVKNRIESNDNKSKDKTKN